MLPKRKKKMLVKRLAKRKVRHILKADVFVSDSPLMFNVIHCHVISLPPFYFCFIISKVTNMSFDPK